MYLINIFNNTSRLLEQARSAAVSLSDRVGSIARRALEWLTRVFQACMNCVFPSRATHSTSFESGTSSPLTSFSPEDAGNLIQDAHSQALTETIPQQPLGSPSIGSFERIEVQNDGNSFYTALAIVLLHRAVHDERLLVWLSQYIPNYEEFQQQVMNPQSGDAAPRVRATNWLQSHPECSPHLAKGLRAFAVGVLQQTADVLSQNAEYGVQGFEKRAALLQLATGLLPSVFDMGRQPSTPLEESSELTVEERHAKACDACNQHRQLGADMPTDIPIGVLVPALKIPIRIYTESRDRRSQAVSLNTTMPLFSEERGFVQGEWQRAYEQRIIEARTPIISLCRSETGQYAALIPTESATI